MRVRPGCSDGRRGERRIPGGVVVVHSAPELGFTDTHERATRTALARKIAALRGADFAGDYDAALSYRGPVYFVPGATLVGIEAAAELGIRGEDDLFGGVVPHRFVATKAITHPLVAPQAQAPPGWDGGFAARLGDAVLPGCTAFTRDDARRGGLRLLASGPVRVKPVHATGGRGQTVAPDAAALERALARFDEAELSGHGVVLEEDLAEVTTYSVGQVRVADLVASYCGTQRLTPDNAGEAVYGGSDLTVVRGGFEALLRLALSDEARLAIEQARVYDAAARACFAGFFASRRNYDVAQGRDGAGRRRSGVLEQSWRVGGASSAEIGALEAFRADPALAAVRAASREIYGDGAAAPPQASVYFRGVDEHVGAITKFAIVKPL